jgi:aminoglycoside phosphotransferase (APT) family kinase protein
MEVERLAIDDTLVRRLVTTQCPQWADFPLRPIALGGWDNKTFHLREHMLVRLQSAADYAGQVEKEHRWLPRLAPLLPLPIPAPLAIGEPAHGYPWRWSIYRWLEGDTATPERRGESREVFRAMLARSAWGSQAQGLRRTQGRYRLSASASASGHRAGK